MNTTVLPKPPALAPAALERRLAEIRRVVAEHYGIERAALTSRVRTEPLATIRQVAMFLAREKTLAPLQTIAASFGREDHGTVAHACEAVPTKAATSPQLDLDLVGLRSKLQTALAAIK